MKLIIAGSRFDWYTEETRALWRKAVYDAADDFLLAHDVTKVFSGVATGVDRLGEEWAQINCIGVKYFPASWIDGRQAGMARNAEMAKDADALLAIWDGKSPGTRGMIEMARRAGLLVTVRVFEGVKA